MDAVRWSVRFWTVAIGLGLAETALVVAQGDQPGIVTGVGVRLVVFALAGLLVLGLRAGSRAARAGLAVLLGALGSVSLLLGPAEWLLDGHGLLEAYRAADGWDLAFAGSRLLHVAAVWSATVAMFTPAANRWFRATRPARQAAGNTAAKPGVAIPGGTSRTT